MNDILHLNGANGIASFGESKSFFPLNDLGYLKFIFNLDLYGESSQISACTPLNISSNEISLILFNIIFVPLALELLNTWEGIFVAISIV
ncbi:hypothetical protein Cp4451_02369 [Clostridium perfringens NCTC 8239]|nr:hypothetical protein [Clostridium perfringens NCTC 8239]